MRSPLIKALLKLTFYSLPLILFAANFTEPRAAVTGPDRARVLSAPVKVTIRRSRPGTANAGRVTDQPVSVEWKTAGRSNPQEVKAYVRTEALQRGVDPQLALWIVKHESSFNPYAKGDGEASRGLWQISKIYHPEVSDAAAFSVRSSTEWSLDRIHSGKVNEWSSYRNCRTLYKNCPY